MEDDGDRVLADILAAKEVCDPAEIVISAWETAIIREGFLQVLSPFESEVLRLYVEGKSYQEIADAPRSTRQVGRQRAPARQAQDRVPDRALQGLLSPARVSRGRRCRLQ